MPHICLCRIIPAYLEERALGTGPGAAGAAANVSMSSMFRSRRTGASGSGGAAGSGIVGGFTSSSPVRESSIIMDSSSSSSSASATSSIQPEAHFSVVSAGHAFDEDGKPGGTVFNTDEKVKSSRDKSVFNAYNTAKQVYSFYRQLFNRLSIDAKNMDINSTVHYGQRYNNAFWTSGHMVYGDGDGSIFGDFTGFPDVIGHELTHGVVENTVGFEYLGQAGALNESMADVFGSLFKQFMLKQSSSAADWLIGQNLIKPQKLRKYALRSLKSPGTAYVNHPQLGTDPQPTHMSEYRNMPQTDAGDWGGVHVNSGIPNHAFYLVAQEIGGNAYDSPGQIWYDTLVRNITKLTISATFEDFARATIATAESRFGETSAEKAAVFKAWAAVGVLQESVDRPMGQPDEAFNFTKTPSESSSFFSFDEHDRANHPSTVLGLSSESDRVGAQTQQPSREGIVPLYAQKQVLSSAERASAAVPSDSQKAFDAEVAGSTIDADKEFRERRGQRQDYTETNESNDSNTFVKQ